MGSITLPVVATSTLKIARILVESLHQTGRSSSHVLKSSTSPNLRFLGKRRTFSTITEEKKPEDVQGSSGVDNLTENEKKLKSEMELLTKDIMNLKERNSELDNKYKRALADGENLRVRLTKQIDDAKLFGIQGFCKDLIEVADILGKATESVPKDQLTEKNPHLKTLYEGLTMTEAQLHKVFKKHGLVSLNPMNEKFDPNQHEALFQQEVEGKEPGTIVVVSKVGYKLYERIVRPALVGVAKG